MVGVCAKSASWWFLTTPGCQHRRADPSCLHATATSSKCAARKPLKRNHAKRSAEPIPARIFIASAACECHLACSIRCFSATSESSFCRSAWIACRHRCTSLSIVYTLLLTIMTRALLCSCRLRLSAAALNQITSLGEHYSLPPAISRICGRGTTSNLQKHVT